MRLLDRVLDRLTPVRRAVLARRRLLAAGCAAIAVVAGLRSTSTPPPATVGVPVLTRAVAAGAVLTSADVRTVGFAPDTVPTGVVAAPVGRQAAGSMGRGEPVTATRLVGATLGTDALTAMPVRFPDAAMVDLLRVGDRVDLLAVDPQGGAPALVARGARVLALPAGSGSGSPTGADALPGRLVVLGVPVTDVSAVADASVRLFLTFAYAH